MGSQLPVKGVEQPASVRPMSIVAMVAHLSYSWALVAQLTSECRRVHWHHLANTTELVLPSARRSPQPKQQIRRFSRLRSSGQKVPILYNGDPFPQNCPFSWGIWSACNSWFLGPVQAHNLNSTMVDSAVFIQVTTDCPCPCTIQWAPLSPKLPTAIDSWAHPSPKPRRHLDQFSCFCTDVRTVSGDVWSLVDSGKEHSVNVQWK